ncbi:MAG: DUF4124 domain-containing protein [Burkholderiaceae bacterium]
MSKTAMPLVAALLVLAAAGASAQNVYKWRDASGVMHISDTPPPAGAAQVTQSAVAGAGKVVEPVAKPASAASGAAGDGELQKKKAAAEAAKASAVAAEKVRVDKENAAIHASNCAAAQEQARVLASGQRMFTVHANGEREVLDDAGIAARQKQNQQAIAENCGK